MQEYSFSADERLDLVIGKKGEDIMIIPVALPNSQAEIRGYRDLSRANQVILYTDRPIYRPGAKVAFRGIVRSDNDALYELPAVSRIKVTLGKWNNEEEISQEVEVRQSGVFYGEVTLPESAKDGGRSLVASLIEDNAGNSWDGYTSFSVANYQKPDFDLDVTVDKEEYLKPDTIRATLSGDYFTGQPLANQKVSYSVFTRDYYETERAVYNSSFKLNGWGGMCGGGGFEDYYGQEIKKAVEVTLAGDGEANIEFSTAELTSLLSQQITILVEKVDNKGNKIVSAKNAIVHQGEFNIFYRPGPTRVAYGDEFSVIFYTESLVGTKIVDKEFAYEIYEEQWVSGNKPNKIVLKQGSTRTDGEGVGVIKESLSTPGEGVDFGKYYYIAAKTQDGRGNTIESRVGMTFYKKDKLSSGGWSWFSSGNQTVLKITSSKSSLKVGDRATLEIVAPKDMTILAAFERERVYDAQWLSLQKGKNNFDFDVHDRYSPSITPTFSFFYNGEYFIEGLSLNVPALHKLLTVEISPDKTKYLPGETAIITITTKDANGNLVSADVGVSIVDKAIYALKKSTMEPLHSRFYYYRPRTTNSSSSLTWVATYDGGRGGGGGGDGGQGLLKDIDTLYWNPSLKTGTDGRAQIEVPLGETQTTWRILTYVSTEKTELGQSINDFLVAD